MDKELVSEMVSLFRELTENSRQQTAIAAGLRAALDASVEELEALKPGAGARIMDAFQAGAQNALAETSGHAERIEQLLRQ